MVMQGDIGDTGEGRGGDELGNQLVCYCYWCTENLLIYLMEMHVICFKLGVI